MRSKRSVLFIVEVALSAALATALDLFSFSAWGQGGSISLQMIPIFIMSFRWGIKGGLFSGFIFGLLQLITGYIISPVQGLLDYPVAFTLVGLSGIFAHTIKESLRSKKMYQSHIYITLACLIGSLARLLIHIVSAVIYFGAGAPANQSVIVYSIIYNASYVIPSFILSTLLISILLQTRKELVFKND